MVNINGISVGPDAWKIVQKVKEKERDEFVKKANVNNDTELTIEEARNAWDAYQANLAAIKPASKVMSSSVKPTGASLMDQIGEAYEVTLTNGVKTKCAVITLAKLDAFCKAKGIDWRKALNENYGSWKKERINADKMKSAFVETEPNKDNEQEGCVHHRGYLVNLDLYQHLALLRAIVAKCPEYKDSIGLYNVKALKEVYGKLSEVGVTEKNISWLWAGEKDNGKKDETTYGAPGIVPVWNIKKEDLQSSQFCGRFIIDGGWGSCFPADFYVNDGVVFFGGLE